jgi:hypothetical protein
LTDVHSTKWPGSSALIALRFPAYLLHIATFMAAGLILDFLIHSIFKQWGQKPSSI